MTGGYFSTESRNNVATPLDNAVVLGGAQSDREEGGRKHTASNGEVPVAARVDFSGRDRMLRNVFTSWGAHLVFVVAGFVLPRVIDRSLGQEALGIWDFAWSITVYLLLTQLGIGSAVNRHVAMYRATDDYARLNGAVSSVMCIQLIAALVALVIVLAVAWFLPTLFAERLGPLADEAQWVVLFLGLSMVLHIACDSFTGVITGCHRWDIHNGLNASVYGLTVVAMIIALVGGSGLATVAGLTLLIRAVGEAVRVFVSRRVCPDLRIRWRYVNGPQMREMLAFGSKNLIGEISALFLYQTTSLLIVSYLGAAALALYARPRALVHHCSIFVEKFASVLTPTVGSLHAGGKEETLRQFFLQATEAGMCLALPLVVVLSVLGGTLLQLWMGPQYANAQLLAVLAIGNLMSMNLSAIWTILRGLGKHGRVAVVRLIASFVAACLTFVVLRYCEQGLVVVALAGLIPTALVDGIYAPVYACRQLGVSLRDYAWRTWVRPLLYVTPFAACLLGSRMLGADAPLSALLASIILGTVVLGCTYWRWVLPNSLRDKIRARVPAWL
jgi:O-antigen/teichoic acid export membrane protein